MKRLRSNHPRSLAATIAFNAAFWLFPLLAFAQADSSPLARIVTEYALTAQQDYSNPDPQNWRLLGSNDDGRSWTVLDFRTNLTFTARSQRRVFALQNQSPYNIYRLEITNSTEVALAGFELAGSNWRLSASSDPPIAISASGEHALLGPAVHAFDDDASTKWIDFGNGDSDVRWLQCQFTRENQTTITNLAQLVVQARRLASRNPLLDHLPQIVFNLNAQANPPVRTLLAYALTSANDFPSRDPRDWRLLGSNDGGQTWQTLDVRRNESFPSRLQRRTFALSHPASCSVFRLQIDSVRVPNSANSAQLAQVEPLYSDSQHGSPLSLVVSAQGENPPIETAEMAFDGDANTKWLDFGESVAGAAGNTNKSTWLQWEYLRGRGPAVINAKWLRALTNRPPAPCQFQIEAVVVSHNPQTATLGLVDETSFQFLQLGGTGPKPEFGQRLRLQGDVRFNGRVPFAPNPQIQALEPLPTRAEIQPGEILPPDQPFLRTSVAGKVMAVTFGASHTDIRIAANSGPGVLLIQVPNSGGSKEAPPSSGYVRADGVVQAILDEKARLVAGVLWVQDLTHVKPISVPAGDSQADDASDTGPVALMDVPAGHTLSTIGEIYHVLQNPPQADFRVKVRGVITFIDLGLGSFYLQDGMDGIAVDGQLVAGLAPFLQQEGLLVELQGQVSSNAPLIQATAPAKVLGRGKMPQPTRHGWDFLMTGKDFSQWIEVEAIVREVADHRVTLAMNGGKLVAWINEMDRKDSLLGCAVRVCGVCAPVVNNRNTRLGLRLLVPSMENVQIVRPAPADPFGLRSTAMANLLQFDAERGGFTVRLVKTTGTVTHRQPHLLFIQDGEDGVRVLPRTEAAVEPGDRVEVAGFPEPDGFSARIVQAVVRKIGPGKLPEASPVDLLETDLSSQDATRGQIEARLLGFSVREGLQILELQDEKRGHNFSAYFPINYGLMAPIPVGSRLRVQGVFKADADVLPDYGQVMTAFQVYGNGPTDVTVLQRPSWWDKRHTAWVLGALAGLLGLVFAWVALLRRQVHQRTRELKGEIAEHERTEAQLQAEIVERKRMEIEVEKTHHELVAASRQAGMAEVATGVLHNVGNALNSVNVSAGLLADHLKKSKTASVAKAASLIYEHEADLAAFFSSDPRGKQLPDYLSRLSEHLTAERQKALAELQQVTKHIDHIKGIVAKQQSYAKVSAVTELVSPAELIEDALRMNDASMVEHKIELVRDYEQGLPQLLVDKHKVLEILVNLIQNAELACAESVRPDKCLRVKVANGAGRLKISVQDNGVGIPVENLTRIFNHGFTTRKDGHGFGLHSGALAARELGGSLSAHSDGPGQGATFILELPVNQRSGMAAPSLRGSEAP